MYHVSWKYINYWSIDRLVKMLTESHHPTQTWTYSPLFWQKEIKLYIIWVFNVLASIVDRIITTSMAGNNNCEGPHPILLDLSLHCCVSFLLSQSLFQEWWKASSDSPRTAISHKTNGNTHIQAWESRTNTITPTSTYTRRHTEPADGETLSATGRTQSNLNTKPWGKGRLRRRGITRWQMAPAEHKTAADTHSSFFFNWGCTLSCQM